jgi:hypothetical protein
VLIASDSWREFGATPRPEASYPSQTWHGDSRSRELGSRHVTFPHPSHLRFGLTWPRAQPRGVFSHPPSKAAIAAHPSLGTRGGGVIARPAAPQSSSGNSVPSWAVPPPNTSDPRASRITRFQRPSVQSPATSSHRVSGALTWPRPFGAGCAKHGAPNPVSNTGRLAYPMYSTWRATLNYGRWCDTSRRRRRAARRAIGACVAPLHPNRLPSLARVATLRSAAAARPDAPSAQFVAPRYT